MCANNYRPEMRSFYAVFPSRLTTRMVSVQVSGASAAQPILSLCEYTIPTFEHYEDITIAYQEVVRRGVWVSGELPILLYSPHMSYSLNSLLKGGYTGDYIGDYYRGYYGGY